MSANTTLVAARCAEASPLLIDADLRAGLALLWQAYAYAQDAGADRWDFALEIDTLYEAGLSISGMRWLAAIATNGSSPPARIPRWDVMRRELWLADTLIKRFRVPASNQATILDVFEEEGWPACIDDPLPPSGDIVPATRLRDAINRLNGNQVNALLRFRANGHGSGGAWELRQPQPHEDDAAE